MQMVEAKTAKDVENFEINGPILRSGPTVAPPPFKSTPSRARPSSSTEHAEESIVEFTREVEDVLGETLMDGMADFSVPSHIDLALHEKPVDAEAPAVGARPPGRKAPKESRCAKRDKQASEAHRSIGERVAQSLDEMQAESYVGWQRANELIEEEQLYSINVKRLQIIRERVKIEKVLIIAEQQLYEFEPTAFGSPSDRAKVVAKRKRRLAELQAQADAFAEFCQLPGSIYFKRRNCM